MIQWCFKTRLRRRAQSKLIIDLGVDLVTVIAPALIHPSVDEGERYRALVRLVKLELPVAEDLGRRLPLRALT